MLVPVPLFYPASASWPRWAVAFQGRAIICLRLAAARRHVRVDGVATECGMARGDPERFPALLAAHAQTAELGGPV